MTTPTTTTSAMAATPGAALLMVTLVPGLLPLVVHPITTTHHPLGLVLAECCIGLTGALVWAGPPQGVPAG